MIIQIQFEHFFPDRGKMANVKLKILDGYMSPDVPTFKVCVFTCAFRF